MSASVADCGRTPFSLRRALTQPACCSAANGHVRSVDLKNTAPEDVAWHLAFLRSEKGHRTSNKISRQLTSRPSIQGAWTPGAAVQPPPASAHA